MNDLNTDKKIIETEDTKPSPAQNKAWNKIKSALRKNLNPDLIFALVISNRKNVADSNVIATNANHESFLARLFFEQNQKFEIQETDWKTNGRFCWTGFECVEAEKFSELAGNVNVYVTYITGRIYKIEADYSGFEISTYQTDIEFGIKSVIAQIQNVINEF